MQSSPSHSAILVLAASLGLLGLHASAATRADAVDAAADTSWDLSELYASPEAWADAYTRAQAAAEALAGYKGSLGGSTTAMLTALDAISGVRLASARLSVYAELKADEDLRIAANQERRQQAQSLETLIAEKSSWVAPEIIALGADTVQHFLADSPLLTQRFDFLLRDTLRAAPHTLGEQAEGVLAAADTVLEQPGTVRALLANGDMPLPTVTLSGGRKVRLDPPAFDKYRQSANRADRKLVFDAFFGAWSRYQGSLGALLAAQVMGDVFSARTRNFPTALEAAQAGPAPNGRPSTTYPRD